MTDRMVLPGPFALSRLAEAHHLVSADGGWLVAVQFRFDEGSLSPEVDPDHDKVDLSFDSVRHAIAAVLGGRDAT